MKGVQCNELFGGIALRNHAYFNIIIILIIIISDIIITIAVNSEQRLLAGR